MTRQTDYEGVRTRTARHRLTRVSLLSGAALAVLGLSLAAQGQTAQPQTAGDPILAHSPLIATGGTATMAATPVLQPVAAQTPVPVPNPPSTPAPATGATQAQTQPPASGQAAAPAPTAAPNTTQANATAPKAAAKQKTPLAGEIVKQPPETYRISKLIGQKVTSPSGEQLGKVEDVILDKDNKVTGIVVGFGGFLGFGKKNVAIQSARVKQAQMPDGPALVMNYTAKQLDKAPEFVSLTEQQNAQKAAAAKSAASQAAQTPPAMGGGATAPAAPKP